MVMFSIYLYNCIFFLQTLKLEEMEKKAGNAESQVTFISEMVEWPSLHGASIIDN